MVLGVGNNSKMTDETVLMSETDIRETINRGPMYRDRWKSGDTVRNLQIETLLCMRGWCAAPT